MKWPITIVLRPIVIKLPPRRRQTLIERKEQIYTRLATLISFGQLTWVGMLYNDPSFWKSHTWDEWLIVCMISAAFVWAARLNTLKAYLSDPKAADNIMPFPTEPKPNNENKPPIPPAPGSSTDPV